MTRRSASARRHAAAVSGCGLISASSAARAAIGQAGALGRSGPLRTGESVKTGVLARTGESARSGRPAKTGPAVKTGLAAAATPAVTPTAAGPRPMRTARPDRAADPNPFSDLERIAIQFANELRATAKQTGDIGERSLNDLRDILTDTLAKVRMEVFTDAGSRGKPGADTDAAESTPTAQDDSAPTAPDDSAADKASPPDNAEPGESGEVSRPARWTRSARATARRAGPRSRSRLTAGLAVPDGRTSETLYGRTSETSRAHNLRLPVRTSRCRGPDAGPGYVAAPAATQATASQTVNTTLPNRSPAIIASNPSAACASGIARSIERPGAALLAERQQPAPAHRDCPSSSR